MPTRLNRRAYEQLIQEDIAAMIKLSSCFESYNVKLEWEHIMDVLKWCQKNRYTHNDVELT